MEARSNPLREMGVALAIFVFVLCIYVGSYVAMVEVENDFIPDPHGGGGGLIVSEPRYPDGGEWAAPLFAPVHWLDRQLRTGTWRQPVAVGPPLPKTTRFEGRGQGGSLLT